MTSKLTRKQEKMKRLIDKLWRDCVPDEMKAAATYRRLAKELEGLGFDDSAKAVRLIVESEEAHKDILNSIIDFLKQKIQIEEIEKARRPVEAIRISKKYAGTKGTVTVRDEKGRVRVLPRMAYLMMLEAGREITLVE